MKIFRKLFSTKEEDKEIDKKIETIKKNSKKAKARVCGTLVAAGAAESAFAAKGIQPKVVGEIARDNIIKKKVYDTSDRMLQVAAKIANKKNPTQREIQAAHEMAKKVGDYRAIEEFIRNHDKKTMEKAVKKGKVARGVAIGASLLPLAVTSTGAIAISRKINKNRDKQIEKLNRQRGEKK